MYYPITLHYKVLDFSKYLANINNRWDNNGYCKCLTLQLRKHLKPIVYDKNKRSFYRRYKTYK